MPVTLGSALITPSERYEGLAKGNGERHTDTPLFVDMSEQIGITPLSGGDSLQNRDIDIIIQILDREVVRTAHGCEQY